MNLKAKFAYIFYPFTHTLEKTGKIEKKISSALM